MNINAIIIEQIDWDETARSFQMKASNEIGDLWVAFPPDYANDIKAPFHFLEKGYENLFDTKAANCRLVKLPNDSFFKEGDNYIFKTIWKRIPTERNYLTYYALQLPEFAVPDKIVINDTRDENREFKKNVFRDDKKSRFIVYLECSSSFGVFNFNIFTSFHYDKEGFENAKYTDHKTVDFYTDVDHWQYFLPQEQSQKVEKYFVTNNHYHNMGDQYNINQAGTVGPNSSANNNVFNQTNYTLPDNTNYEILGSELTKLKQELISKATLPEHYIAIGEVANAEEATKSKDGNKVVKSLLTAGKWVLDAATDIGTSVVAEIINKQMGS
jgi:hypothetical protein